MIKINIPKDTENNKCIYDEVTQTLTLKYTDEDKENIEKLDEEQRKLFTNRK